MVSTIKFSQMTNAGNINNDDVMPSLRDGENVIINNPWAFLAPGTTAQRPTPSATINYRLRLNTDTHSYEYYDAVLSEWIQTITVTPSELTATPDVNVTITLGGTPESALLQPASITLGWTGALATSRGGLGTVDVPTDGQLPVASSGVYTPVDLSGDATLAPSGALTVGSIGGKAVSLSGAFTTTGSTYTFTGTLTGNTAVTFPTSGTLATTAGSVATLTGNTGVATASAGNINVTGASTGLTFTGASSTLTLGGTLGLSNGGTNNALTASAGGILWSDASKLNVLAGTSTANQILLSGNAATPVWSTTTYPPTNAINTIMYASSANVLGVISPVNNAVLISSAGGSPSMATTLPSGLTIPAPVINQIVGTNGFPVATFADVASTTDYFSLIAGIANGAKLQLISSGTNASFKMLAKGTGGVIIGSAAATTNPMTWSNSTNSFAVSIPTWTGDRTLTLPDANVTLVSGTMLSNALTSAHIFVGNGSNVATDVALSGDGTLANTGALTIASIGGKAVSLGGSFTMSGAFSFAGTLTGNTTVTFPTSGTLATTGQVLAKTNITAASQTLTVNTAHTINTTPVFAICNLALPTTAAVGDIIQVKGNYSLGWTITQNSGQTIRGGVGSTTTGVTGAITSSNRYDFIELTCVVANTDFEISGIVGNISADVTSGKIFNATNSGNVLTLGGAFTMSGAFSFTGTLTGNTTVTFPTSGTLATLAGTETFTNKTITGTVNPQTGTTYTLVAADLRGKVLVSNASAITVTLPQQSTLTTAAGVISWIENIGTTDVTLVKEGAETLSGNTLLAAGATALIYRDTTTNWSVFGGTLVDPWQIPADRIPAVPAASASYVIVAKAKKAFTITGFSQGSTSLGTAGTYTIKIDGTNVTGLTSVTNTTTLTETAATAANLVAIGQQVTITFDGTLVAPVGYYGDLSITQRF